MGVIIIMKEYSAFPKVPGLESYRQKKFSVVSRISVGEEWSYCSAEMKCILRPQSTGLDTVRDSGKMI